MSPRRGMFGWCHSLEKDAEFQIHCHPSKPGSVAEFDGVYGRYGYSSWVLIINHPGWWLSPTPLKNDGVRTSWDDDIPNIWKNKSHVPNHQPAIIPSDLW